MFKLPIATMNAQDRINELCQQALRRGDWNDRRVELRELAAAPAAPRRGLDSPTPLLLDESEEVRIEGAAAPAVKPPVVQRTEAPVAPFREREAEVPAVGLVAEEPVERVAARGFGAMWCRGRVGLNALVGLLLLVGVLVLSMSSGLRATTDARSEVIPSPGDEVEQLIASPGGLFAALEAQASVEARWSDGGSATGSFSGDLDSGSAERLQLCVASPHDLGLGAPDLGGFESGWGAQASK